MDACMNWDDLRLFLTVARQGSLTAAAPAARADPATLSRRIARLEQAAGAALFAKSPQGYALTEAGRALLPRAEEAERAIQAGLDRPVADRGLTGSLRIGAPDGCANFILPQVVARISAQNPGLDIQILSLPRVVNLSRREADLAITVSPPDSGRLTVQKITDYRLHLAQRADLSPPAGLADLGGAVVGYIPDMIFDRELDYLAGIGVTRVQRASNAVSVQLQMLRQGGIGIVHDFALPFAPELTRVLTAEVSLTRAFHLVRHADDRRSERINRLSRAVAEGVRAEVARLEALVQRQDG
jgi:DNA-binding transcriptional LysR family regulator